MIYCDYNATTPMHDEVLQIVVETMKQTWGNSFSPHSLGRKASVLVEEARGQVADLVGTSPRHVRFTSGATEANSWVLQAFSKKGKKREIYYRTSRRASRTATIASTA